MPAPKLIGLTGGIATGKSTVSGMLRELGAQVLDADEIAREVVEPGTPGLAEVAARFPGVVGPDGRLDRAKLGERIFGDDEERRALNAILHPRIQGAFLEKSQALADAGAEAIVYDAALLIENGLHRAMDGVILVAAPREVQVARLVARNGLSREQAEARIASQMPLEEARIASQMPLEEKRRHATWIVDNAGELASTRRQVEAIWKSIRGAG